MYEVTGPSTPQRVTLAVALAICLALALWLLLGGGIVVTSAWFHQHWNTGVLARRSVLAGALSIYFVRVLFTDFVFLRRGMSWAEVGTIAPWVLCLYILLSLCGGTNPTTLGIAGIAGTFLFLFGSWMNTHAELQRHRWKAQPDNRGRLYTQGLFRLSRHPNYLGDLLSFSGLCTLTGRWYTAIIPLLMLAGFVFVNIPALDAHLQARYGSEFIEYAGETRKLIPFLY